MSLKISFRISNYFAINKKLTYDFSAILKDADLSSTSAKKVRQELEEKLDANLQSRKKEIDDLVMEFVSAKQEKKGKKGDSEEDEEEEEEEEEEEVLTCYK